MIGYTFNTPEQIEEAAKRRCKKCNKKLTPQRYFHCFDCVKEYPTEDALWEQVETFDLGDKQDLLKAMNKPKTGNKVCKDCNQIKCRTEFYLQMSMSGETHRSRCISCYKKYKQELKARKQ